MTRVMPLGLQRHRLVQQLEAAGQDPSRIDLDALLDKTLSFRENQEALARMLGTPLSGRDADDKWRRWEHEERQRSTPEDPGSSSPRAKGALGHPSNADAPAQHAEPHHAVATKSFRDFQAPGLPVVVPRGRGDYAGLTPHDAATKLIAALRAARNLRDVTARQKLIVVRRILADMHLRGWDLANLTPDQITTYRAYLDYRVKANEITTTSASHVVKVWNSTMRAALNEVGKAGDGLIMRTFPERIRRVDHVTEQQFSHMLHALFEYDFHDMHDWLLFHAYLELEWSIGARIGSLAYGRLQVRDFDFEKGTVLLWHMKNRDFHTTILTKRAQEAMGEWIKILQADVVWEGPETPIFMHADGRATAPAWVNRHLKAIAKRAGITQIVTSHVLRKSVGTIIALTNPKFAQQQLGISDAVFHLHYNQPSQADLLNLRHLLPGVGGEAAA